MRSTMYKAVKKCLVNDKTSDINLPPGFENRKCAIKAHASKMFALFAYVLKLFSHTKMFYIFIKSKECSP